MTDGVRTEDSRSVGPHRPQEQVSLDFILGMIRNHLYLPKINLFFVLFLVVKYSVLLKVLFWCLELCLKILVCQIALKILVCQIAKETETHKKNFLKYLSALANCQLLR